MSINNTMVARFGDIMQLHGIISTTTATRLRSLQGAGIFINDTTVAKFGSTKMTHGYVLTKTAIRSRLLQEDTNYISATRTVRYGSTRVVNGCLDNNSDTSSIMASNDGTLYQLHSNGQIYVYSNKG